MFKTGQIGSTQKVGGKGGRESASSLLNAGGKQKIGQSEGFGGLRNVSEGAKADVRDERSDGVERAGDRRGEGEGLATGCWKTWGVE